MVATLLNFGVTGTFLVLVVNLQQRGVPASVIGLLETGIGIGGLLGSIAAPRIIGRFRTGTVVVVASWAITLAFSATAFSNQPLCCSRCCPRRSSWSRRRTPACSVTRA